MKSNREILDSILFFLIVIFFSFMFVFNMLTYNQQQFSHLAESFLKGKLYFTSELETWNDTVLIEGKHYWPQGPFPAVLLMPFVFLFGLFDGFFYQGYLQFFLVLGVFYFVFQIAKKVGYSFNDCLFLAFGFSFASVFLNVAVWPWSWWFSQVIVVFFLTFSIVEYLGKRRYWLIGLAMGLALATRVTAGIGLIFFILEIFYFSKRSFRNKLRDSFMLIIFPVLALILLGFYNLARFGDFIEQGYAAQILWFVFLEKARSYGLFGLVHLPGNLYHLLLAGPLPVFKDGMSHVLEFPYIKADPWGMSIFVTSPYFLYLFFLKYKDKFSKILWLTVVFAALPILLYYGVGFLQFGYRYALDFLPFLFWLLARNYQRKYKRLSFGFKALILISACSNLFFFFTLLHWR